MVRFDQFQVPSAAQGHHGDLSDTWFILQFHFLTRLRAFLQASDTAASRGQERAGQFLHVACAPASPRCAPASRRMFLSSDMRNIIFGTYRFLSIFFGKSPLKRDASAFSINSSFCRCANPHIFTARKQAFRERLKEYFYFTPIV